MTLQVASFLPVSKGIIDTGNPSLDLTGAVRSMKGFRLVGANKIVTRDGSTVALTLKDDQGSPADVTSVCGVWQYKDRAVAVAHSTNTNKVYLYLLKSDLSDWYDGTAGTLQGSTTPHPAVVIWSSITIAPDVFVAEGLGFLYIAHAQGIDSSALNFPTKQWDGTYAVALTTLKMSGTDGSSAGTDDCYANGCIAYQDALWVWGYGTGNTTATAYRPELARFSPPSFGNFQTSDSLTLGNRVRSDREHIISGGLAGNALILQGTYITSRIIGYGRASWTREIVDESSGITGPKAGVSDDAYWYYWSAQGPMRIGPQGPPEPLYEAVAGLVSQVVNPEKIAASRDVPNNLVMFHVDTGSGVRTRAAYHTLRNFWITANDDDGVVIKATGEVAPVISSTSAGVAPPAGPPTALNTTQIGGRVATLNWTAGDATAQTQVEYQLNGASIFTVVTTLAAGIASYQLTGLNPLTDYNWRVAHVRAGQFSAYGGPLAFTTTNQLLAPTNLSLTEVSSGVIGVSWTNSEPSANTEVYAQGPGGGGYVLKYTAVPGQASANIAISGTGAWQVEIRHVEGGFTSSVYDGPNTITIV